MLLNLPTELILGVGAILSQRDINALAQTNIFLSRIFDPYLYRVNLRESPESAILWAARHDRPQTAKKAISAGAIRACQEPTCPDGTVKRPNASARDTDNEPTEPWMGERALWLAANRGSNGVVRLLLGIPSIDVNHKDRLTRSAPILEAAINSNHTSTLDLLLASSRVNPEVPDVNGRTPLCAAAAVGNERAVELLLQSGLVDPEAREIDGRTPFALAVQKSQLGTAKLLLETHHVDVNARDMSDQTPLGIALTNAKYMDESDEFVRMLLGVHGVDLNAKHVGNPPLMLTVKKNLPAIVELLVDSGGVDPNATGDLEKTPLHLAVCHDRNDVVEILLRHPDVDCTKASRHGHTPLAAAAFHGCMGILRMLVGSGKPLDPNRRDDRGRTALWWAAFSGNSGAVEVLIQNVGSDVHARDQDGNTAYDIAKKSRDEEVVRALER